MVLITFRTRIVIDYGIQQDMQIGEVKGKCGVAKNMLAAGADVSFIAKVTGLSVAEINQLLKS